MGCTVSSRRLVSSLWDSLSHSRECRSMNAKLGMFGMLREEREGMMAIHFSHYITEMHDSILSSFFGGNAVVSFYVIWPPIHISKSFQHLHIFITVSV